MDEEFRQVLFPIMVPNNGVGGNVVVLPGVVCSDGAVFQLAGIGTMAPMAGIPGQMRTLLEPEWMPLPPVPGTEAAARYNEGTK